MHDERVFRTEAIVIKRVDLGEADRLLTLYTPHRGRLRAAAKGARKPTSRLGGHLELFSRIQVMVARGRNLDYVTQVETLDPFLQLRDDLEVLSRACYLAELVDQFGEDNTANEALYDLLRNALSALPARRQPDLLLRHFELHVLGLSGYQPELSRCVTCRRELMPVTNSYSPAAGGVLCPQCAGGESIRREVSVDLLKSLRYLQANDWPAASQLRLKQSLQWELEMLLGEALRYTLERQLKSVEFLQLLRRTGVAG